MNDDRVKTHGSRDRMAEAVAHLIAGGIREACRARGRAGLVLSGGGTPVPVYERLSDMALPWQEVTLTLADERRVAPDHPASNEGLIRRTLHRGPAAAAQFIGLETPGADAPQAERAARDRLDAFPWPADIVLLGMGEDGHTASLFPGAAALARALAPPAGERAVVLVPDPLPPDAPFPRLTLTLPALLDARRILLLIAGEKKRAVLARALEDDDTMKMPVRAILRQSRVPVEIHWAP